MAEEGVGKQDWPTYILDTPLLEVQEHLRTSLFFRVKDLEKGKTQHFATSNPIAATTTTTVRLILSTAIIADSVT